MQSHYKQTVSFASFCFFAAISFAIPKLSSADTISPNIQAYVNHGLVDFSANMHLVKYDAAAGRRINKDFGLIYEWMKKSHSDLLLRFKLPDMMRIDGRFGAATGIYIVNSTSQDVRLSLGLNVRTDLSKTPGKRKTLLDMGLLSEDYLGYTEAQFMGARPFNGKMCAVFSVSYRNKSLDTSHRLVWIDPETKITVKREEFSQDGKLRSIWYYRNAKEVAPNLWMPSIIEIDDNEGNLAGETEYRNVKVNIPMSASLFK